MSFDIGEQLRINGGLLAMLLGYLAAEWYAGRRAPAHGISHDAVASAATWALVAALVSGRLVAVLRHPGVFVDQPVDILLIRAGINLLGALAGAAIAVAVAVHARRSGVSILAALDLLALAALAGIATRRAGCVINNACYGKLTGGPLGVLFPGLDQPRYPSEPLEAILVLLLFAALVGLPPVRGRPGLVFAAFLAGYGLARFMVDFTRVAITTAGPVSADQAASLAMAVVGLALALALARAPARAAATRGATTPSELRTPPV